MERWCVFDTETTNLVGASLLPITKQPHIMEFAGLIGEFHDDGSSEITHRLEFICAPGVPISADITRITGLTQADIANKQTFFQHLAFVTDLFSKATHRAAHNLTFDESMLDFEYERAGISKTAMDHWRNATRARQKRICTVEKTEHMFGFRCRMSDLYMHLTGKLHSNAHRAMPDVEATWECIVELRKRGIL